MNQSIAGIGCALPPGTTISCAADPGADEPWRFSQALEVPHGLDIRGTRRTRHETSGEPFGAGRSAGGQMSAFTTLRLGADSERFRLAGERTDSRQEPADSGSPRDTTRGDAVEWLHACGAVRLLLDNDIQFRRSEARMLEPLRGVPGELSGFGPREGDWADPPSRSRPISTPARRLSKPARKSSIYSRHSGHRATALPRATRTISTPAPGSVTKPAAPSTRLGRRASRCPAVPPAATAARRTETASVLTRSAARGGSTTVRRAVPARSPARTFHRRGCGSRPGPQNKVRTTCRAYRLPSDTDARTPGGSRDPADDSGSFVGRPLELRVRWNVVPGNVRFEAGGAYLFAGELGRNASNATGQGAAHGDLSMA